MKERLSPWWQAAAKTKTVLVVSEDEDSASGNEHGSAEVERGRFPLKVLRIAPESRDRESSKLHGAAVRVHDSDPVLG